MKGLKKLLKWTAIVGAALIAILLIINAVAVWTTGSRLEKRMAALRAAGDPVTLPDLARDPIPPEQNAAVYLRRARNDLEAIDKELIEVYSSDRYVEGRPSDAELKTIESTLDAFPNVFPLLEQAAACQDYDPQRDYTLGNRAFLDDQLSRITWVKRVERLLTARGLLLISQQEHEEALNMGVLGLRLARHFQREPMLIGYLISLACRGSAAENAHRALHAGKVSKAAREALDAELDRHELAEAYQWSLKSERTYGLDEYQQTIPWRRFWFTRAYGNTDVCCYLDLIGGHLALTSLPYWEAAAKMKQIADGIGSDHPLPRLLIPAIVQARQAMERNRARMRCLRVLNAVQGYVERTGEAEPKLADLGLPDEATIDPFTGEPLQMKKLPEGWLVYSVGKDLTDDGGQLADDRDVGFRPRPAVDSAPEKKATDQAAQ